MPTRSGRHFLQIPGPTNVPDRVLRAIDAAVIDHRGVSFANLARDVLTGLRSVFKTEQPVVIFPASGTGAWEAALVNTLSPGDSVLMCETGHFATQWKTVAVNHGLDVSFEPGDWRSGADPERIEARLHRDRDRLIQAVCVVHNETSTGVASRIPEIRAAMDRVGHPALLMVDTISSLASMEYRHDDWGVDVTVAGSQKGLMLPPGLSFNAISEKALRANRSARLNRSYWRWEEMLKMNDAGFFPYTPATNLLYGLREALAMLGEEGLDNVFARHARLAEATRRAVLSWGLEIQCKDPREFSQSLTAVRVPEDCDADAFRRIVVENFDMSLGNGLGKLAGRVFRIGHLGDFNELMLAGTLAGVEMGLKLAGIPYREGGVLAAMDYLTATAGSTGGNRSEARAWATSPADPSD